MPQVARNHDHILIYICTLYSSKNGLRGGWVGGGPGGGGVWTHGGSTIRYTASQLAINFLNVILGERKRLLVCEKSLFDF